MYISAEKFSFLTVLMDAVLFIYPDPLIFNKIARPFGQAVKDPLGFTGQFLHFTGQNGGFTGRIH
ncbi:hypothetical protein GCM10009865_17950 [Aeromicrobium ponti]